MIESVAVRQRGAFDFSTHYDNLCALQNSCPMPAVKAHLSEGVLDINGDRIRATDWVPVLNTLRINKTLDFIAVRSYFQQTLDEEKGKSSVRRKTPAIRSKEITYRLCKTLRECLTVTPSLTCIELQGLPLRERDLTAFSKGLAKNGTLQHLSLEYSTVGDEGLEIICEGVKNSPSITSLNFTGCGLSWKGSDSLAKLIKHQAMRRHNEAWQDSLRYRRPDLDRMPGIRRITINANPMLADQGAIALAEALKDDLWLKALDLQQCGLSNQGAKALLDVLKYNTTIIVLDVRQNPLIDQDVTRSIMEQVMINSNGEETEYKWIKASLPQDPAKAKPKKKRTKTLQSSFGKKTIIKVSSGNGRRRTKSAGSVSRPLAPFTAENIKPGPGLPWRTALRANRYRGYPPEHIPGQTSLHESLSMTSSPVSSPNRAGGDVSIHVDYSDTTAEEQSMDDISDTVHATRGTPAAASRSLDFTDAHLPASTKQLKIELEGVKRRLKEEINARAKAEERVLELTIENRRMRQEMEDMGAHQGLLDDDQVLESIESTFQQFHAFLDLLRDAGLGQLISMAGLDQTPIPLDGSESFLNRTLSSRANKSRSMPNRQDKSMNGDPHVTLSDSKIDASWNRSLQDISFQTHIIPENYGINRDPTMRQIAEETILDGQLTSKFDELYQRVLNETEGALSKAKISRGPNGDANFNDGEADHSVRSQLSQKSHASQASQKSQQSQASQKSLQHSHRSERSEQSLHSQRSEPAQLSQHSLNSHHSQSSHQSQLSQHSQHLPSQHSDRSQKSLQSHKSQPSQPSHISQMSQKSQPSQPSHISQLSQKSQSSQKSQHSNGLPITNGTSGSKPSPPLNDTNERPPLNAQKSVDKSNPSYSQSFEKSLSEMSDNIEDLLEDPDDEF